MDAGLVGNLVVVCRVGRRLCGLPVSDVVETMRPLPVQPVAGAPKFVSGVSIIRGNPVPVVDAAALLADDTSTAPTRFVTLAVKGRQVALAVDEVTGVRALTSFAELPPLLNDAGKEAITAMGRLDADLLTLLQGTRLVPDAVWSVIEAKGAPE
ncbi:MAG TPA: chemotaxis protein CheW [Polyangia bacterium]